MRNTKRFYQTLEPDACRLIELSACHSLEIALWDSALDHSDIAHDVGRRLRMPLIPRILKPVPAMSFELTTSLERERCAARVLANDLLVRV